MFRKVGAGLKSLPSKKSHLDFILATLTVPVLLIGIITNIANLQQKNAAKSQEPAPTQIIKTEKPIIIQTVPEEKTTNTKTTPETTPNVCKKQIGPISISSPSENQTVNDNPVCIIIKQEDPNYCSSVWSYRINGGSWSEYSGNSPCLYNMPSGNMKFELRIQSTVSDDQMNLTRNFEYQNNSAVPTPTNTPAPTLTPSPTATSSAGLN